LVPLPEVQQLSRAHLRYRQCHRRSAEKVEEALRRAYVKLKMVAAPVWPVAGLGEASEIGRGEGLEVCGGKSAQGRVFRS